MAVGGIKFFFMEFFLEACFSQLVYGQYLDVFQQLVGCPNVVKASYSYGNGCSLTAELYLKGS